MPTKNKPEAEDQRVVTIKKTVNPHIVNAERLVIDDELTMKAAVELLSNLNRYNDKIGEEKEKITEPAKQIVKVENARWKPLEDTFKTAIALVRGKMIAYQTEQTRKADEDAAKIAARTKAGKGNLSLDSASKRMDEIVVPEKKVEATSGGVRFQPVKCFEVVNLAMVPIQYHLANEVEIRAQMKLGNEIPGVRYYVEQRPVNNR